jgi:putative ABC transport system permease protein
MSALYRLLLRLYPRSFRERLGSAMAETFEDEFSAARSQGLGAVTSLAARTLFRTPLLALEERVREWTRGGSWTTDIRHAVRGLARSPGFALVTAVTVGLGVGATVSLYSVVDAMLLQPLPVLQPDRLFRVHEDRDAFHTNDTRSSGGR